MLGQFAGLFQPRVPGAQWAHGAMGNASREGVSLRTVLDRAASPRGRPRSASAGWIARSPMSIPLEKSLALDHSCDGEVMIAFVAVTELPVGRAFFALSVRWCRCESAVRLRRPPARAIRSDNA